VPVPISHLSPVESYTCPFVLAPGRQDALLAVDLLVPQVHQMRLKVASYSADVALISVPEIPLYGP
jgi:hypothetical protein